MNIVQQYSFISDQKLKENT